MMAIAASSNSIQHSHRHHKDNSDDHSKVEVVAGVPTKIASHCARINDPCTRRSRRCSKQCPLLDDDLSLCVQACQCFLQSQSLHTLLIDLPLDIEQWENALVRIVALYQTMWVLMNMQNQPPHHHGSDMMLLRRHNNNNNNDNNKSTTHSHSKLIISVHDLLHCQNKLWMTLQEILKGTYYMQQNIPLDRILIEAREEHILHAAVGIRFPHRMTCLHSIVQRLIADQISLSSSSSSSSSPLLQKDICHGRTPLHVAITAAMELSTTSNDSNNSFQRPSSNDGNNSRIHCSISELHNSNEHWDNVFAIFSAYPAAAAVRDSYGRFPVPHLPVNAPHEEKLMLHANSIDDSLNSIHNQDEPIQQYATERTPLAILAMIREATPYEV
jgi:hypothetical protein